MSSRYNNRTAAIFTELKKICYLRDSLTRCSHMWFLILEHVRIHLTIHATIKHLGNWEFCILPLKCQKYFQLHVLDESVYNTKRIDIPAAFCQDMDAWARF